MSINWAEIRTMDDVVALGPEQLYDYTPEETGNYYKVQVRKGLTPHEKEDAIFWSQFTRGLMLLTGPPGSGKGLFMNMAAWKMKYYFMRTAIFVYKPRVFFGEYVPFNKEMIVE